MENSFENEWELPEFDSIPKLAENAVYLLSECSNLVLRKTLQETYRDFCKRSSALRTWRKIQLDPGKAHYPISPILSSEIDCVTRVRWPHGVEMTRRWRVEGDPPVIHFLGGFLHHIFVSRPDIALVQDRVNVGSLPVEIEKGKEHPCSAWSFWVEAVEIPHLNEERAPKVFLRRYGDAIVDGALARLFMMTGRPWSDGEQARERAISYQNAVSEARQRTLRGSSAANPGPTFTVDMSGSV